MRTTPTQTFTSNGSFTVPANTLQGSLKVECWGPGGSGSAGQANSHGGGGGGAGAYAAEPSYDSLGGITYGSTSLTITVPAAGSVSATTVTGGSATVSANGGLNAAAGLTGANGGAAGSNTVAVAGGNGGNGRSATGTGGGGGGGGCAGTGGGVGGASTGGTGGNGADGGGNGGNGGFSNTTAAQAGGSPGGGGGGGGYNASLSASAAGGAGGQVTLTWTLVTAIVTGYAAGSAVAYGSKVAGDGAVNGAGAGLAYLPATVRLVNQWSGTFSQPVTFGNTPPELESVVVGLTVANAAGFGSGVPTPGNWLFAIVGWNQQNTPGSVTVGVNDDIHSWWRPFAPSYFNASTRTTIWYTPNLANSPQYVYVAPSGLLNGMSVLIVEVAGIGPWDTVTGTNSNYGGNVTSLTLALGAPSGAAFTIAGVCGDNDSASQAFAPASWTTLATVTATDGSDHLCDAVLTSAMLPSTAGSLSVSATASATDLSGFMIQVLLNAASPIPAGHNPNWPYLFFEAGFGSGFETPLDQITWTDLTSRLWDWDESTGVQYQLAQLRATDLNLELDNNDNYLASLNTSSPYYPNVQAGTPLRIRAAIGTLGGVTSNRWYVIQRNGQQFPEAIDENWRRYSPVTGADYWSAQSATGPTYYRGEVATDTPYAWWTMDDQPKDEGVQPTTLANSALGNVNPLNITLSPNGATLQQYRNTNNGTDTIPAPGGIDGSIASYVTGADSGWMWGDPVSQLNTTATGVQVSQEPGSAAWQALGQAGSTGSYGYFLYCNDSSFPQITAGITVEGWFNYEFLGSAAGLSATPGFPTAQQPTSVLTLFELATSTDPVAKLQLTTTGTLQFITYASNTTTGTTNSIYTTSDLRDEQWFHVAVNMTQTAWTVYVNGGLTATVSGSATATSPVFQWLFINGDLGNNGGTTAGTGLVHGGNVSVSHFAIYGRELPIWRILAHYDAAVASFGQLPAPLSTAAGIAEGAPGYTWAPDGTFPGSGYASAGSAPGAPISAIVVAVAGSYTSGPSVRSTASFFSNAGGQIDLWVQWTGVADKFNVYTAAAGGSETLASVVRGTVESYGSGYGNSASGGGVAHVSGGTGASPPANASNLGDTVGQRIERIIGYGTPSYNFPNFTGRCIDPSPLLVKAPAESGQGTGIQSGVAVQEIQQSDGGLLFIDNLNNITYWMRTHLASQYPIPVWQIGPNTAAGQIPYYREIQWISDPQRVWNAISITPVSPGNALLPVVSPSNAIAVDESQSAYGVQPLQIISWLQSATEQQSQANWLFSTYGYPRRRVERVRIDAAAYPQAWSLVLGINVGDTVNLQDWAIGNTGTSYIYRVSQIRRHISFGAHGLPVTGSVELQCDYESPTGYWT